MSQMLPFVYQQDIPAFESEMLQQFTRDPERFAWKPTPVLHQAPKPTAAIFTDSHRLPALVLSLGLTLAGLIGLGWNVSQHWAKATVPPSLRFGLSSREPGPVWASAGHNPPITPGVHGDVIYLRTLTKDEQTHPFGQVVKGKTP